MQVFFLLKDLTMSDIKSLIEQGQAILGIELGSTRIKAELINPKTYAPIASGSHTWENRLENGIWTYHLDEVWTGIQNCYKDLVNNVQEKYDAKLTALGGFGVSAMMHGYLAFDKNDKQLCEFRTWRNTNARDASEALTDAFQFNIPERWSISHLYQCILDNEEHVKDVDFFTTLAGYIHWQLTGRKVLGIGDAAGMFPIDSETATYKTSYLKIFNDLIKDKGYSWKLEDLLPEVLSAGEDAGSLTEQGAKLLDPTGSLKAGCKVCPPEGDAGTGMVATNAVAVRTGNVSAGTSIFAMIVLEKALSKLHREIDNVTTPDGKQVAMVHANNCTSDLNAWVNLFSDFAKAAGFEIDMTTLFKVLYNQALNEGDPDCGGVLTYGYFSGEFITNMKEGRPLLVRTPEAKFNVANLMRSNLNTSLGAIRLGMDILADENVNIDKLMGHGGLFKTPVVGQQIMADALNIPVTVMTRGIAVLAAYNVNKAEGETLPQFLDKHVFVDAKGTTLAPKSEGVEGFNAFMKNYVGCLKVEQAAVECLK